MEEGASRNMTVIDYEKLRQYVELFSDRVIKASRFLDERFPDQSIFDFQSGINFHEGFIQMEEGYKNAVMRKYKQYLHPSKWDDRADGIVAKEVLALIYDDELDNLLSWYEKEYFKSLLEDRAKKTLLTDCMRDIFLGDDDMASFQRAEKCIGRRFPIISYLFFIKNPDKYLPVKPKNFANKFQSIGISGWRNVCSWENYQDFISAVKNVQNFLMEYYRNENISLLDAHSFIWMSWMDNMSEDEFLALAKKHCIDELKTIQKKLESPKGCKEVAERIESELPSLEGKEREAVVKSRVNQGVFRSRLLLKYSHCCLCRVSNRKLLVASHIKPWAESKPEERLDWNNGFLMCPNHDRLFDEGFISFGDDGGIMIADSLSETDRRCMNICPDMSIKLTEGNRRYLQHHRKKHGFE